MENFTREGLLGCLLLSMESAGEELKMDRRQKETIVEYFAEALDFRTNADSEKTLKEFYADL